MIDTLDVIKNINNIYESNTALTVLKDFERVLDELDLYVYENWEDVGGLSFLPFSDHVYEQAPYQDITGEEYEELKSKMPESIRWSDLSLYELIDSTTGSQELACVAGECEVVDLSSGDSVLTA